MLTRSPQAPSIFVSRYAAGDLIVESGLVPVGITVGKPKFRLPYPIPVEVDELKPFGLLGTRTLEDFVPRYIGRLERFGADRIAGRLDSISAEHEGRGLVLLCFENVASGEWCHRQVVAAWWRTKTGAPVRELETGETPPEHVAELVRAALADPTSLTHPDRSAHPGRDSGLPEGQQRLF